MKSRKQLMIVLTTLAVILATAVFLPGVISAGDLEPPGPPASTMKTLDQIPPIWSQKLPASERFELVMGGAAVLDKETGLVWEKSPTAGWRNWYSATSVCYRLTKGERKGWRLPTIAELSSLVGYLTSNPALPTGHPFNNVELAEYWSSTTLVEDSSKAWTVDFTDGLLHNATKASPTTRPNWCVRGGQGHDAY